MTRNQVKSGSFAEDRNTLYLYLVLALVVYIISWSVPIIEIDAAQYANMSREMLHSRSFLQLYDRGQDYLDKPPMLFWLSSLSMYFFGINGAAYRLPSFLFSVLSIYSTYRLALLFYKEKVAILSALVLATSQAMFLINHDVRTDTMLMGWVVFSVWQLAAWYRTGRWSQLLAASVGIAGGMMTKGPIALLVPVFCFLPHFFLQRKFKEFFRWEYLIMLLVIGLLLLPMSLGLYRQFDLHPEKVMYGRRGNSGLRFFFWTQSFGRITGESTWSENGHFYFLFQNLLWGFLPWTVFFVGGLIRDIILLFKKKFRMGADEEWITTGGFLLTYCALGMSRYQLPHYIYVVLPMASVMTGNFLYDLVYTYKFHGFSRKVYVFHAVLFSLLMVALFLLLYLPFPPPNPWLIASYLVLVLLAVYLLQGSRLKPPRLVSLAVFTILITNICLDLGFYPPLMQYQHGYHLSRMIRNKGWDKDHFFIFGINEDRSLHFYSDHFFRHAECPGKLKRNDLLLTSGPELDSLDRNQFTIIDSLDDFHVSTLSLPFLNPATRAKELKQLYILRRN